MQREQAGDLRRVTIVGPRKRFDIAIPGTAPLAQLLPALLGHAGADLPDAGAAHGGWALQRLGGWPLDTAKSAIALGVRDGEVLYFRPRRVELTAPVFDDPAESIGWTLAERTARWSERATRAAGLAATAVLLAAGSAGLLMSGRAWHVPAALGGAVSVVLILIAATVARTIDDRPAAAVVAACALPYGAIGGLLGTAGDRTLGHLGAAQVLAAFAALLAATALAGFAVGIEHGVFFGGTVAATIGLGSAFAAARSSAAGGAAVGTCLALLLLPLIPTLAYRSARLPKPYLPGSAEDLRRETQGTSPAASLALRTLVADRLMTAATCAVAAIVTAAAVFLVRGDSWPALALAADAGVLLASRALMFTGLYQRGGLLLGGAASIVLAALAASHRAGALAALIPLGAAALAAAGFALNPDRTLSPVSRRLVDVGEALLMVAAVPLALQVLGVYTYLRSLSG